MRIRKAVPSDLRGVQGLFRQIDDLHAGLLPSVFRAVDGDARPDPLVAGFMADPDRAILVADEGGTIGGFVLVRRISAPPYPMFRPDRVAVVEDLVVDRTRRGEGLGRALLDAAIGWAASQGIRRVQVHVWEANAAARAFYETRGFRPVSARLGIDLGESGGLPDSESV